MDIYGYAGMVNVRDYAARVKNADAGDLDRRSKVCDSTKEMLRDTGRGLDDLTTDIRGHWEGATADRVVKELRDASDKRLDQSSQFDQSAHSHHRVAEAIRLVQQQA